MPLPEQLGSRSRCVTCWNRASSGVKARKSCLHRAVTMSSAPASLTIFCRVCDLCGSLSQAKSFLFLDVISTWPASSCNERIEARCVVLFPGAAHASRTSPTSYCSFPRSRYAGKHEALSWSTISPFLYASVLVRSVPAGSASRSGMCLSTWKSLLPVGAVMTFANTSTPSYPVNVPPSCRSTVLRKRLARAHLGCTAVVPENCFRLGVFFLRSSTLLHALLKHDLVSSAWRRALCRSTASLRP